MVETYNIIAHTYLTYLVKVGQNKLTNCWRPNIGQTVKEDAELLYYTISELVRAAMVATPAACFLKHPITALNCRVRPTRFLVSTSRTHY